MTILVLLLVGALVGLGLLAYYKPDLWKSSVNKARDAVKDEINK